MSLLARAAAQVARVCRSEGVTLAGRAGQNAQQTRAMGGHAHHGNPEDYVTYAGLKLKKAPGWEYALSKVIGGTMWFWIFYMGYHEWEHKTVSSPKHQMARRLQQAVHQHRGGTMGHLPTAISAVALHEPDLSMSNGQKGLPAIFEAEGLDDDAHGHGHH